MENLDELFSFTAADALKETESKKKSFSRNTYKPSINDDKCVDKNYRALGRFLPFIHEGKVQTNVDRYECYLKDVNDDNLVFVVSPKTVGKPCPIRNLSYKLYKSDSAVDQANSKKINVNETWYSLFYIVKDAQHPELNGTVVIYNYGKKIHDKIVEAERGSEYTEAVNPFDFYEAPLFEINMTKSDAKINGKDVPNYDGCRFIAKTSPITFGEGENVQTLVNTPESKKAYIDWLANDAPKIENLYFKEWSQEITDKVNANLASYVSGYEAPRTTTARANETLDSIAGEIQAAKPVAPAAPSIVEQVAAPAAPVSQPAPVHVDTDPLDSGEEQEGGDDDAWLASVLG